MNRPQHFCEKIDVLICQILPKATGFLELKSFWKRFRKPLVQLEFPKAAGIHIKTGFIKPLGLTIFRRFLHTSFQRLAETH